MKKIFLFLAMAGGMATFTSCDNDDDVVYTDNDTISEVFQVTNIDFSQESDGRFYALVPLDPPIFDSDVILVFRREFDGATSVWAPLPQTIFLGGTSEVNYDYNFTANDIQLIADGTIDLTTAPQFTQDQTFRIVIVPGYFANTVDVNSYDAVIEALGQQGGVEVRSIEN